MMAGSLSPFARRVVTKLRLRISETELRTIRVIIPSVMAPAAIAGRIRCCMREEKV